MPSEHLVVTMESGPHGAPGALPPFRWTDPPHERIAVSGGPAVQMQCKIQGCTGSLVTSLQLRPGSGTGAIASDVPCSACGATYTLELGQG